MNAMAFLPFRTEESYKIYHPPGPVLAQQSQHQCLRMPAAMAYNLSGSSHDDLAPSQPFSYFEEAMSYPYTQAWSQEQVRHPEAAFRPLGSANITLQSATVAPLATIRQEDSLQLPAPSVLDHHVDASQYMHFPLQDFARASIDYPSPSSMESSTSGPRTPNTDQEASFSDPMFENEVPLNHTYFLDGVSMVDTKPQRASDPAAGLLWTEHVPDYPMHVHGLPYASFLHDSHQDHAPVSPAQIPTVRAQIPPYVDPAHEVHGLLPGHPLGHSHEEPVTHFSRATSIATDPETDSEGEDPPTFKTSAINGIVDRRQKDDYLLEMRRKKVSYKDIKRLGGYQEAESTLRGRVRVLTKEKWERVRKPRWNRRDVRAQTT